jgi:hypothetical protein
MAYSDVSAFLGQFDGGARPNRYRVRINGPQAGATVPEKLMFLCRSASIPSSDIGIVEVPYMGRPIKVAGDKTFNDWTITVYNDTVWDLRSEFEKWMDGMLSHEANVSAHQNAADYLASGIVEQLDRNEAVIQTYRMSSIFPSSVGEITLSYDSATTVEEFSVTFAINWWESDSTT